MTNIIIISSITFIVGFIIGAIIFNKKSKDSALFILLNDFKKTLEEYKNQNTINTKEVKDAIKNASELTKILTTNQNLKGQFGEDCLEAILNYYYPNKEINYIKQFNSINCEDKKIKPDYLIKLPNNKSILIDCKLNLEKYIEYKENNDENLIETKKNDFIKDLNLTINNLHNKKYETAKDIHQCDFILMYIPLEPILTLIYTDNDFNSVIKNANEKNIIIVGNSSVLTTLRLAKMLWAQNTQENNMQNIIEIAQNIYEYIANHSKRLYEIKKQLEENTLKFNKEYEKITSDNKLFKYTQKLKEYGIQSSLKRDGKKLAEISIQNDFLNN